MERKILLALYAGVIFLLAMIFISAEQAHGTITITSQNGTIYFGNACHENWTSSFWTLCDNGIQTFACYDSNQCNTTTIKPKLCGTTRACGVTNVTGNSGNTNNNQGSPGGSPSSGGGPPSGGSGTPSSNIITGLESLSGNVSKACMEDWQCGNWSNQKGSCGTRTCADLNNCGTTELKPFTTLSCSTSSITGGVIGSLTSPAGISIIVILLALGTGTIIFFSVKKNSKKPRGEKKE